LEQPVEMKKSLFIVLAFALLNSGCSTVGLVYRNADWYLQHKINGYTSFTAQQKETIHLEVLDYMRWHRKNALPEYIIFLQNLNGAAQYKGQLSVETTAQLRVQLMDLYKKTMLPAIQPGALLLSSLDKEQIQELDRSLAEDIQQQIKDKLNGTLDENLDTRADKTVDFLEWLAGNLSKDQEKRVREMSRRLPFISPFYIQNREENQRRLIALLNSHASADEIAAYMTTRTLTPEATRTPSQQQAFDSFEAGADEMVIQIHSLLTDQQKEHINEKVSGYIEDMRGFSREVP
jgi:hypothetical protein